MEPFSRAVETSHAIFLNSVVPFQQNTGGMCITSVIMDADDKLTHTHTNTHREALVAAVNCVVHRDVLNVNRLCG